MVRSDFVQESAPASWLEPIDAYRRLCAAGLKSWLLDGSGEHPNARFAFIGLNPTVEVRMQGSAIEERHASGAIEAFDEEPRAYLRRRIGARRNAAETAPFTGGWIGVFGFGFAHALEPTLPPGPASSLPDALLRHCPDALVLDRRHRTATVFAADTEGDRAGCADRVGQIVSALAVPAPAPAASRGAAEWTTSLDQAGFEAAVTTMRARIHNGDLFQANLATRFSTPCAVDPAALFAALQASNPSPSMALLDFDGGAVVCGSPEQLFAVRDGRIESRPIAGTRRRGATPAEDAEMERELRHDAKEQAEHTMLVDLVRNDVARVAVPGSVRVTETASVERYRHVMHLASRVEGRTRPGTDLVDWLAALFPGGTVTGAPKVRATQRILEAEPVARGFYTGSVGYLSWSHNAEWNIVIRSLQLQDGIAHVHAGSGIVADSDPGREWHEAQRKAKALLDAATGDAVHGGTRLGEVAATGSWSPPRATARHAGKSVLLVDNYDSFVHNLADYCSALGATVTVVRNDADVEAALQAAKATHVILSPGPGWPDEAGATLRLASELHGRLPVLGVCLGHQAIGQAHGGRVHVHPAGPVHGKPDDIHHEGVGLFAGLPTPLRAARYHSLVVDATGLGADWLVDARLADGTVMALRHRRHPTFGVQFHPESLCTPRGLELLDRFLEETP